MIPSCPVHWYDFSLSLSLEWLEWRWRMFVYEWLCVRACVRVSLDKGVDVYDLFFFFFLIFIFWGFFGQLLWHSSSSRHLFYYPKPLNKHIIVPFALHPSSQRVSEKPSVWCCSTWDSEPRALSELLRHSQIHQWNVHTRSFSHYNRGPYIHLNCFSSVLQCLPDLNFNLTIEWFLEPHSINSFFATTVKTMQVLTFISSCYVIVSSSNAMTLI